jgi:small subunit ribosomal protein S1
VVQGTVTRVQDFGAFVKIAAGVEGLLHVSEMGGGEAGRIKVGQAIAVVVKNVDPGQRRIGLVPAPEGAAAGTAVRAASYSVGQTVRATVDKIETYGVFVQIEGTKGRAGRGLIPNAELGTARGSDTRKHFKVGAPVEAKILETGDGRLRMSLKAVKDDEERADFDGYRERSAAASGLGTLGDLLKKKS